jgi:hypothetical protein
MKGGSVSDNKSLLWSLLAVVRVLCNEVFSFSKDIPPSRREFVFAVYDGIF